MRAPLLSLFAGLDANGDGYLSHEELQTLMTSQGHTNKEATVLYYKMQRAERDARKANACDDAAPPAGAKDGVALVEFLDMCAPLGFTAEARGAPADEAARALDELERLWLTRQPKVIATLRRLRAYVARTGGDAPTAYPSGDLLVRARAALAQLSSAVGAVLRGKPGADVGAAQAALGDVLATLERGEVAMAIETAGKEMEDSDEGDDEDEDEDEETEAEETDGHSSP